METLQSKVTSKGQIVIPKEIRARYHIRKATIIHWVQKREGVLMVPDSAEDAVLAARGMIPKSGMLEKLLQYRSADRSKENGVTKGAPNR
ncbi:MAG: AbrB/MazE/SpoVT family DNA-binding domain-containing protein [Desulfobacteraceae bacterium]|nr:AbrB/MazE/SpoVT family DNA-binding domain-containing protein [Desulfobacteraceae bacterium]